MRPTLVPAALVLLAACSGAKPAPLTPPPDTQLTGAPQALTSATSATFAFSSDAADATFRCAIDTAAPQPCTSPATFTVAEGTHRFEVAAVSKGSVDPSPASASWRVDTTAPTTAITQAPSASGSVPPTAQLAFTASEPDSTFRCQLDSQPATACTSPVTFEAARGAHTFTVYATDPAGNVGSPVTARWTTGTRLRVMAANLTSGNYQSYDDQSSSQGTGCKHTSGYGTGEGIRIFQGLKPDVVAIQELNWLGCDGSNSEANIRAFVDTAFGSSFGYYREPYTAAGNLPNGIISRYPIIASGDWTDAVQTQPNRGFAWAQIDVPGPTDLYVISVHLLTSSDTNRDAELKEILTDIQNQFPAGAWIVLAGDFNTHARDEIGITDVSTTFVTGSPYPADQQGNDNTNSVRQYPDDWVLATPALDSLRMPVAIGGSEFKDGLVFDSRVYTPLSEVAPVQASDSGAASMQHMGVVRDFLLP